LREQALIRQREITSGQALAELWVAIGDLMPFPCNPDLNDAFAINMCPMPTCDHSRGEYARQPIRIRFGQKGLAMYQCSSEALRHRIREDVVYVVTMMLRAYNLRLHASRMSDGPFVIDCELVLHPA